MFPVLWHLGLVVEYAKRPVPTIIKNNQSPLSHHDEAVDDDFLGVLHQREIAKVRFPVFDFPIWRRLQCGSRLLLIADFISVATRFLDLCNPYVLGDSETKCVYAIRQTKVKVFDRSHN